MTRDDSGAKIVRATTERFGRLDILVNNAGINMSLFRRPDVKQTGKFWEVTPQEFRRIIEVNVVAAFLMTRAALAVMLKQRWGRIINVTTSLDTMYRAGMQPYGGSKAANEAHLLALAQELEGTGVTANVLVPGGAADTRMVSVGQEPDRSKLVSPDVMVAPLLWLCSNESDGVTGQRFIGSRWDQKLTARRGGEKGRRAGGLAAARPPGDHAGGHALIYRLRLKFCGELAGCTNDRAGMTPFRRGFCTRLVCTGAQPFMPQTFVTRSTRAEGALAAPSADGAAGVIAVTRVASVAPEKIAAAARAASTVLDMDVLLAVAPGLKDYGE